MYALAIGKYTSERELRLLVNKKSDIFKASTFNALRRKVDNMALTTCAQGQDAFATSFTVI